LVCAAHLQAFGSILIGKGLDFAVLQTDLVGAHSFWGSAA
jgi:hypothetical protein